MGGLVWQGVEGRRESVLSEHFFLHRWFGRECRAPNIRHFHHHVYQHHCSVIIIIIIIVTISIIIILHDYQVISRHADHQHYDCSD